MLNKIKCIFHLQNFDIDQIRNENSISNTNKILCFDLINKLTENQYNVNEGL